MRTGRALRRAAGRLARRAGLFRDRDLSRRLAKVTSERDAARATLRRAVEARDALGRRVAALGEELDRVHAGDALAAGRDREDLSYVFVVTYGRSGSTLLQGILSSTPGVMIRGENGGVLADLFRFHDTVRHHQQRLARPQPLPPNHPWWGIDDYPTAIALRDMRLLMLETVLRPEPETRVVGFKEIVWYPERLPEYLQFVRDVFPGARFVLNTRNLADVARSKWWAGRPEALTELHALEERYVAAVEGLGDVAYRVHYDDYVHDPGRLRGLFEWLDEPFDEARVSQVLAVRHSY